MAVPFKTMALVASLPMLPSMEDTTGTAAATAAGTVETLDTLAATAGAAAAAAAAARMREPTMRALPPVVAVDPPSASLLNLNQSHESHDPTRRNGDGDTAGDGGDGGNDDGAVVSLLPPAVPKELGQLTKLSQLSLDHGNAAVLPSSLGKLTSMQVLGHANHANHANHATQDNQDDLGGDHHGGGGSGSTAHPAFASSSSSFSSPSSPSSFSSSSSSSSSTSSFSVIPEEIRSSVCSDGKGGWRPCSSSTPSSSWMGERGDAAPIPQIPPRARKNFRWRLYVQRVAGNSRSVAGTGDWEDVPRRQGLLYNAPLDADGDITGGLDGRDGAGGADGAGGRRKKSRTHTRVDNSGMYLSWRAVLMVFMAAMLVVTVAVYVTYRLTSGRPSRVFKLLRTFQSSAPQTGEGGLNYF